MKHPLCGCAVLILFAALFVAVCFLIAPGMNFPSDFVRTASIYDNEEQPQTRAELDAESMAPAKTTKEETAYDREFFNRH
jgi:hypothetical protein